MCDWGFSGGWLGCRAIAECFCFGLIGVHETKVGCKRGISNVMSIMWPLLFVHFKSTVMRPIFSLAIVGMFLASGTIKADVVLASNTSAAGKAANISQFELEMYYSNAEIRITGIRLFFITGLSGAVTGTFRDGNGNSVVGLAGTNLGADGNGYDLYQFNFSGTSLNNQSTYYGAYNFQNSSNAILAASTSNATINYISGFSSFGYSEVNGSFSPPFPANPRFELIGVPEPGTLMLGSVAALCGAGAWWRRRRAKGKHAENRLEANGQAD